MKKGQQFHFFPVIIICAAFALLSVALIGQQYYGTSSADSRLSILPADSFQSVSPDTAEALGKESSLGKECLVLVNSTEENSVLAEADIRALFK